MTVAVAEEPCPSGPHYHCVFCGRLVTRDASRDPVRWRDSSGDDFCDEIDEGSPRHRGNLRQEGHTVFRR